MHSRGKLGTPGRRAGGRRGEADAVEGEEEDSGGNEVKGREEHLGERSLRSYNGVMRIIPTVAVVSSDRKVIGSERRRVAI